MSGAAALASVQLFGGRAVLAGAQCSARSTPALLPHRRDAAATSGRSNLRPRNARARSTGAPEVAHVGGLRIGSGADLVGLGRQLRGWPREEFRPAASRWRAGGTERRMVWLFAQQDLQLDDGGVPVLQADGGIRAQDAGLLRPALPGRVPRSESGGEVAGANAARASVSCSARHRRRSCGRAADLAGRFAPGWLASQRPVPTSAARSTPVAMPMPSSM